MQPYLSLHVLQRILQLLDLLLQGSALLLLLNQLCGQHTLLRRASQA